MPKKLRFGIVGGGTIAAFHAEVSQTIADLELAAICDLQIERARNLADRFGNPAVYADRKAMFEEAELDLVSVCVPTGLHGEVVLDAAAAGVHALCEKPLEVTREKMDAMIGACDTAGVKLGVVHQLRTMPMWMRVADVLRREKLGRLVLGDVYLKYFRPQSYYDSAAWRGTWALDGGGCLMNQGVHYVDLLQWLMGPVASVYAYADHLAHNIEVEDTAAVALRFRNGAFGVISAATSVIPGVEGRVEVHGCLGSIRTEGEKIQAWHVPGEDLEPEFAGDDTHNAAASPMGISNRGHRIYLQDMCRAIWDDRPPMLDGRQARRSVDIILACYESAATARPVEIPEPAD